MLIDKVYQWKQGGSFAEHKYIKSGHIDNIRAVRSASLCNLILFVHSFIWCVYFLFF